MHTKDDNYLLGNFNDKIDKYISLGINDNSNFLDSKQLNLIVNLCNKRKVDYLVHRYINECDKAIVFLGEVRDVLTCFKIDISNHSILHRNILGSIIALGIKNDLVGDIFVEDGVAYIIVMSKIAAFLQQNLKQINQLPVDLTVIDDVILREEHLIPIRVLVNSFRVDLVTSKILNVSRGTMNDMIAKRFVFVNYNQLTNNALLLKENDIVSVRGNGKYKIGKMLKVTKNNNYVLELFKYK